MALPVTVIDLSTRMVAGWSLSERMTADIAASALASAKSRGYAAGNAISRADRGAQHANRTGAHRRRCICPAAAPAAAGQRRCRVVLRHAQK